MKKEMISLSLVPLLMASTKDVLENTYKYDSKILSSQTNIYRLIDSGSVKEICPSHILNNEAASVTFNYEVFEKKKDYAPYVGYKTSYHLIYRADIFLSSNVHYKGGVGNRFDGYNPAYIDSFKVTTTFKGGTICDNDKTIISPELVNGVYSMIDDLASAYGVFGTTPHNYISIIQGFDANLTYNATGYGLSWEKIIDFNEYSSFNNRLVAKLYQRKTQQDKELKVVTEYDYGYNLYFDNEKNINTLDNNKNEFISGPNKEDNNFKFSIFGGLNLQTEKIDSITIDILLKSVHGSSMWLDTFRSNATIKLDIKC